MSEANKLEAEKCLDISKKKYSENNTEGAVKFAKKSLALYETKEALAWLDSITPRERKFTADQVKAIKDILKHKQKGDLYGILGLDKDCSESDLKKAYRKLALQFHPDKCNAPGTDDAFKAIGHAFQVLSDKDKRESFDRFGTETERPHQPNFAQEMTPEELFNMFFSQMGSGVHPMHGFHASFGGPNVRFQAPRRQEPVSLGFRLLQLAPLFILLFSSTINSFFSLFTPSPMYSMHPTAQYSRIMHTLDGNIEYWMSPNSLQGYDSSKRSRVERQVRSDYAQVLRLKCINEKEFKTRKIQEAYGWFTVDQKKLQEAQEIPLYSCIEYQQFYVN